MTTMRSILFEGPRTIRLLDEEPIPEPDDGEVLVRCTHIGLCGSNRGPYLGIGRWADGPWPQPAGWMGHENVGVIVKSRNAAWSEGTPVLVQSKNYNGFAEYLICDLRTLTRLPDGVDGDLAKYVIAQPLATVMRAMDRIGSVIGERCAVVGQGPIGLMFTYLLHRLGARQVIAVDSVPWRLEWSKRLGATDVVDATREDTIASVKALTGGALADVVVEAVGDEETYITSTYLTHLQGRLCLFGVPDHNLHAFPWFDVTNNETEIILSRGPDWVLFAPTAIAMVAEEGSPLADLVTPRMPWAQAAEAFEMYAFPAEHRDSLKLVLDL